MGLITTLFGLQEITAQDWANLKQFQNANAQISTTEIEPNRVVFMGNSITIGWLNARPGFFKDKPYINRGISGQTTPQMLIRFRQDVIDLKPKVVVILAGTNDIAGNTGPSTIKMIVDNIKNMAQLAHANHIKVVLASTLPVFDYPWKPGLKPAQKIMTLNSLLMEYAKEQGSRVLRLFLGYGR